MGRLGTAFRAFFRVLGDDALSVSVRQLLDGTSVDAAGKVQSPSPVAQVPATRQAPQAAKPTTKRSEAIDLLSAMQREARFIDFIKESLGEYDDAQIGAAVRDIHHDCAKLFDRVFALQPVAAGEEGSQIELPTGFEAARFRLTGNVTGQLPIRGRLVHGGWQAQRCEIPAWTGSEAASKIISPAEVEIT
jgi:uncharacterized protein DUF2760